MFCNGAAGERREEEGRERDVLCTLVVIVVGKFFGLVAVAQEEDQERNKRQQDHPKHTVLEEVAQDAQRSNALHKDLCGQMFV